MKKLFKKYINSTLTPKEFVEVSDFLREKKYDSTINELIKPLWHESFDDKTIPERNNPTLKKKIKEAILQDKQETAQHKIKLYSLIIRVAAVLLIALMVSNIIFFQKSSKSRYSEQIQTITTPYGAKTNITLPDGSSIHLNSGTTLSYSLKFRNKRNVTLVGEAYFEVEKSDIPFVVSTNYGEVEVKGTSFNVKAFSDDNSFETTLVEGSVVLRDSNGKNSITLSPGQYAVNTSNGFNISEVETKYYTSWKEGKLIFNREPFPSFIKKLERWYNVKIEYSDPKLNEIWYTGTIEMESIQEVMEMISKSSQVKYTYNNKTRILYIKQ